MRKKQPISNENMEMFLGMECDAIGDLLIKDLPDSIKMLAKMNQYEEQGIMNENVLLKRAFGWYESPQGGKFWRDCSRGVFPKLENDANEDTIN